jgi:putative membrane protein
MDYPQWLLCGFGLFWLALAIRPKERDVWLTENILTTVTVVALVATWRNWPLGHLSYTLIAAFGVLHTIGGHYTYALVPFEPVSQALGGTRRNHYDRVVHFAYGLLVAYPFFELLERYAQPAGAWSYVLSPALIMATSMAFEVLEWCAACVLGGDAALDYLGAQGDPWDAQKDMALATGGAIVTMLAIVLLH